MLLLLLLKNCIYFVRSSWHSRLKDWIMKCLTREIRVFMLDTINSIGINPIRTTKSTHPRRRTRERARDPSRAPSIARDSEIVSNSPVFARRRRSKSLDACQEWMFRRRRCESRYSRGRPVSHSSRTRRCYSSYIYCYKTRCDLPFDIRSLQWPVENSVLSLICFIFKLGLLSTNCRLRQLLKRLKTF